MSRNLVVLVLSFCVGGTLTFAAGQLSPTRTGGARADEGAGVLERHSWLALWAPLFPALLAIASLLGWAAQEPTVTDELLHPLAFVLAAPFALRALRAAARAVGALRPPRLDLPAVTIGLLRPRVVVSSRLRAELAPAGMAAVHAHERAHALHRDPLRIWLAQVATDLQGSSPGARERLSWWMAALELARDEEARRSGVAGEDLATALVVAARIGPSVAATAGAVATLSVAEADFAARVHRLLAPLPPDERGSRGLVAAFAVGAAVAAAGALGLHFGDVIVRALPVVRT
jgi:hypothetical protein